MTEKTNQTTKFTTQKEILANNASDLKNKKSTRKVNIITKKANPTNLVRGSISNKSPWMDDYQDFFTHKQQPVSEAFLKQLGQELVLFAETTTGPLRVEWFFTSKRIPPQTALRWAKKHHDFGQTYEISKYIIGMRRENGAIRKEFDVKMVLQSLHLYDPEFKEIALFHAKIKIEAMTDLEGRQVIILPRIVDERLED